MSTSSAVRIESDALSEASSETFRPSRKPGVYKRTKKAPPPPPNAPARTPSEDCAIDERLEGTLDLRVVLPDRTVELTVDRRTAILDVLVQATAGTKFSPGSHSLQCQPGGGTSAPNTPVGTLDTRTLYVVPKTPATPPVATSGMPFAPSIRVSVNLPRKQLAVIRSGPTTALADIKRRVCQEHSLDFSRHRLLDPRTPDSLLDLNTSLADFGHNELTLISNDDYTRSRQEFIPLNYPTRRVIETNHHRTTQGLFDMLKKGLRRPQSRKKDEEEQIQKQQHRSSVSLPVTRSTSPARSDSFSTRSLKKKAPPPPPPTSPPPATSPLPPSSPAPEPSSQKTHSRHSSDSSSGYHEASVLSDSPESSATTGESPSVSPRPLDQCPASLTTSRTSVGGTTKKRRAPPPPAVPPPSPPTTDPAASSEPPRTPSGKEEEDEVVRSATSTPQGKTSPEDLENRLTETFILSPIKRSSSLPDLVEISPELETEEASKDKEDEPTEVWEIPDPPSPFRSGSPTEKSVEPEEPIPLEKVEVQLQEVQVPTEELKVIHEELQTQPKELSEELQSDVVDPPPEAQPEKLERPQELHLQSEELQVRSEVQLEVQSKDLQVQKEILQVQSEVQIQVHSEIQLEVESEKVSQTEVHSEQLSQAEDLPPEKTELEERERPEGDENVEADEETGDDILEIMPRRPRLENFSIGTYKKPEEDIYGSSVETTKNQTSPKQNGVIPKTPVEPPKEVIKNGDETDHKKEVPPEPVERQAEASAKEVNGMAEYQKQLEQFRHLEQQFMAWKEQLEKNQVVLEKSEPDSSKPAERSQTLPRRPTSLQIEERRVTATLNRRSKPQAAVTIGSWDQRPPSTIKEVLDSDIVYSKRETDTASTRRKQFASSATLKSPSKPAPAPPRKSASVSSPSYPKPAPRSEVKKAPSPTVTIGKSVKTPAPPTPPVSQQFMLMRESIKFESKRPSAQSTPEEEAPQKKANGAQQVVSPVRETVKVEVKVAATPPLNSPAKLAATPPLNSPVKLPATSPLNSPAKLPATSPLNSPAKVAATPPLNSPAEETVPKPSPRRFSKMNGDPAKSVSDSKAALMEELKKRLTPSPPPSAKTFPPSPPRRPKSASSLTLDPRAELMLEIRNFAGRQALHPVTTP